ncbi:MAG: DsbA family protein [Pseudomonadota bacterium]
MTNVSKTDTFGVWMASPDRRRVLAGLIGSIGAAGVATLTMPSPAAAQEVNLGSQVDLDDFMKTGDLPENSVGKDDAPVTIVEYASMTCPHCARFHNNVLGPIKEKYIDTGKVRFIMREFPLDQLATAAFMLARCAGSEKHYAFSNVLYKQQEKWAFSGGNPVPPLRELAKQAGITREQFDTCLKDQKMVEGILDVRKRGQDFGVRATPTLFINGRKYNGNLSVSGVSAAIDSLLKAG